MYSVNIAFQFVMPCQMTLQVSKTLQVSLYLIQTFSNIKIRDIPIPRMQNNIHERGNIYILKLF